MDKSLLIAGGAVLMLLLTGSSGAVEWSWTGAASTAVQAHLRQTEEFPWLRLKNPTSAKAGLKNVEIEIEHIHLAVNAELNDRLSFSVAPCIEHEGTLSIRTAFLEAAIWEMDMETLLSAEVGRFLVPFGRFNYLAEVTNFPTISRPMMFASHDQDIITFQGFPHPLFMSQYSEIGLLLNGNKWFMDQHQLWYGAWVGNGMYQEGFTGHKHGGVLGDAMKMMGMGKSSAAQDEGHGDPTSPAAAVGTYNGRQMSAATISWLQVTRFATDNNSDKAFGGRLAYGFRENLSAGVSYMTGSYDPDALLPYSALGFDASLDLETGIGRLTTSGEFVNAPISYAALNDTATKRINIGEYTLSGYYIQAVFAFAKRWEAVGMYDYLQRVGPETKVIAGIPLLQTGAEEQISLIRKISGGLNFSPAEQVKIKTEYAFFRHEQQFLMEQPDNIHRVSSALVVSF